MSQETLEQLFYIYRIYSNCVKEPICYYTIKNWRWTEGFIYISLKIVMSNKVLWWLSLTKSTSKLSIQYPTL